MDNNEYTIYCAKCGAEMSSNARYCMKCGTLNYDHEANKSMKGFMPKDMKMSYKVGSGKFLLRGRLNNQVRTSLAAHTGNKKICFIVNLLLFLLTIIFSFIFTINGDYTVEGILNSDFPLVSLIVSIIAFYLYSFQLLFMKCNLVWWKSLIPFYNVIELSNNLYQNKWIGILCCIPGVGIIGYLALFYKLGIKFQYNSILCALFPIIFIPLIGYGTHLYDECMFVDGDPNIALEKDYKRKKNFMLIVGIFFLFGIGVIAYNRITNTEGSDFSIGNYYYVYAAKQIVKKVEKNITSGNVTCTYGDLVANEGVYYFYFADFGDEVFLPFYIMREPIYGSVRVEYSSGVANYYVSLTDGKKGFSDVLISTLKTSSVKDLSKVVDNSNNYNTCSFK